MIAKEYSKQKLQEWVSKTICQKLSLDILNIDYDMAQKKDRINKDCLLYKERNLVDFYVRAYPFNIGAEIGLAVKQLFSKDELAEACQTKDYTHIYEAMRNHFINNKQFGKIGAQRAVALILDYKLNGYVDEEVKE